MIALISLVSVEAALRIQQLAGPIYDLQMNNVTFAGLSDVLNHKAIPGTHTEPLKGNSYGVFQGKPITRTYDANGILLYPETESFQNCAKPIRILFLGDSFIEGYDYKNTLPYQVAITLNSRGLCIQPLNAAVASYSPAIFVPQARQLLPLIKPDYVVVSIDETDFFDDNMRYRHLIHRDAAGRNIGVEHSYQNYVFNKGFIDARDDPLYLSRLVRKIYHSYVRMPRLLARIERGHRFGLFELSGMPTTEARDKFRQELEFFKANISELVDVVEKDGPGSDRLFFIRNPHLQHLKGSWNLVIRDAVMDVASTRGVRFYDGQNDLSSRFSDHLDKYYWKNDVHFNFDGLSVYSEYVAKFLFNEIDP